MKTTFNTMTMGRLLFTMLCLFAASSSYAQKYKDALIFEMKGHVKECVMTQQRNEDEPTKATIRFSQDGELIDDLDKYTNFTRRRDGQGRIVFESWDDDMRDETTGLPCIQEHNYVYDSQNLLVEEYGKMPVDFSTISFKETYEFDSNGNIIKKIFGDDTNEDEPWITNYKIEAVDQKGNWTVRTWTSELGLFTTNSYKETRVIHYYEDNTVRHTLQRGESLELLAERYKTTVEDIKAVNPDMEVTFTGMEILLPTAKTVSTAATTDSDLDAAFAKFDEEFAESDAYFEAVDAAGALYDANEYKKARKAYTDLIEKYPDMVSCEDYYNRALCCYKLGKYRAAENDLTKIFNDSECTGKLRENTSALLDMTRQRREEIHEKNANIFGGLLQVAANTTAMVMQAKEQEKMQKAYKNTNATGTGTGKSLGQMSKQETTNYINKSSQQIAVNTVRQFQEDQAREEYQFKTNFIQQYRRFNGKDPTEEQVQKAYYDYKQAQANAYTNAKMAMNSSEYDKDPVTGDGEKKSTGSFCGMSSPLDYIHCNGTGRCSRCDGKKKYYSTAFGIGRWYDCHVCHQSGICPSCGGKVSRAY